MGIVGSTEKKAKTILMMSSESADISKNWIMTKKLWETQNIMQLQIYFNFMERWILAKVQKYVNM